MTINKRSFRKWFIFSILLCVLSPSIALSKNESLNVRLEIVGILEGGTLDPSQLLPVNICFDFTRDEKNYSDLFQYEISLVCNGKTCATEKGTFEPPQGVAIKRTTICKTFKLIPGDFLKPQISSISLKARVLIDEARRGRIKEESRTVEASLKTDYRDVTVSGTVLCPSELPLSLVKIEIFCTPQGEDLVRPYSHATAFTDGTGFFTATVPSRSNTDSLVTVRFYCPGEKQPALVLSGDVSENQCSFGIVRLACQKCLGALATGSN